MTDCWRSPPRLHHFGSNVGPNQPFVLHDDPLVLHALEPQRYGDVTIQAEVWEGGRQRAPQVKLCFPDDLSGTKVPSLKHPACSRPEVSAWAAEVLPGRSRGSLS